MKPYVNKLKERLLKAASIQYYMSRIARKNWVSKWRVQLSSN